MASLTEHSRDLHPGTTSAILREKARRAREQGHKPPESKLIQQWKHAASLALHWSTHWSKKSRSKAHYRDQLKVSTTEHMSSVDPFDGEKARRGEFGKRKKGNDEEDLLVVTPYIDGRLKDKGRN